VYADFNIQPIWFISAPKNGMYFDVDLTLSYYSTNSAEASISCQFPSARENWAKEIFKTALKPSTDWEGHIKGK